MKTVIIEVGKFIVKGPVKRRGLWISRARGDTLNHQPYIQQYALWWFNRTLITVIIKAGPYDDFSDDLLRQLRNEREAHDMMRSTLMVYGWDPKKEGLATWLIRQQEKNQ